jgi:hypothetical protein
MTQFLALRQNIFAILNFARTVFACCLAATVTCEAF